jgi:amidase
MARTAADVALGLSVLGGADIGEDKAWQLHLPTARHETLKDFRVAMMSVPEWIALAPEIREAQSALADSLGKHGVSVTIASPEAVGDWQDYYDLYLKILGAMLGARATAEVRAQRLERMKQADNPGSAGMITGLQASVADLFGWLGQREQYRRAWRAFFESFDVFVAPATMRTAYPHVPLEGSPFASSWQLPITVDGRDVPYSSQVFYPGICTLPGLPSTAVPVSTDEHGLPIGLQVLGPYLEDYTPLRFAALLEQAGIAGFKPPASMA